MSLSLKNIIYQAIIKVAGENPALDNVEGPTAEQARDDFIRLLFLELFPEDPTVPAPPSPSTSSEGKKERKKRAPMTEEQKAAMKAKRAATVAAKAEGVQVPEPETTVVEVPVAPEEPKERKKRGPMTEEQKEAMKAKRAATLAAKKAAEPAPVEAAPVEAAPVLPASPVAEKPKKEKKAKNADANLPKVDPTWRKHLKAAAKTAGKEYSKEMESGLLTYVNTISNVAFHSKKAEEHIADFLAVPAATAAGATMVETDLVEQEFEGKTYFVNPETKRVYEVEFEEDGETVKVTVPVGYVGMAAFADMVLDEE